MHVGLLVLFGNGREVGGTILRSVKLLSETQLRGGRNAVSYVTLCRLPWPSPSVD